MDQAGTDPLTYLLNFGVAGVVLVLWLTGLITSRREVDRATDRAGEWKAQYEREAEAHLLTLRALNRERDRMDSITEANRTTSALLSAFGHLPITGGGGS